MKTTAECYQALLDGEILVDSDGVQARLSMGFLDIKESPKHEWVIRGCAFTHPQDWQIKPQPVEVWVNRYIIGNEVKPRRHSLLFESYEEAHVVGKECDEYHDTIKLVQVND